MKKITRLARISSFFVKLSIASICSIILQLFSKKYQNIWIIAERGDDARDNGYFFYQFIRKHHPELEIYYVITRNSADFFKVAALGKWVEYNSLKHFMMYKLAKVRISSSLWGGDLPRADYFYKLRKYVSNNKKIIFLQHGITKDYLPQFHFSTGMPNLFICGAKLEYEYIVKNFGYPDGAVQYTGLARFDNLHNLITKNKILIMPTFRMWLQGKEESFVAASEYVNAWNQILNDGRLESVLAEMGIDVIFYPHYIMQSYIDSFHTNSEHIIIAKSADYDVQQLLMESKLLITDFSSVFFDFGYMKKPVIYYQFDRNRYISEHYDYTKGYFDYDTMGFGEVALNHENCVSGICKYIHNNFQVEDNYKTRMISFFPIHDTNNCERIYEAIKNLDKL